MLLACVKEISLFKYAFFTKIVEVGFPVKKLIVNNDKAFWFSKSFNGLKIIKNILLIKGIVIIILLNTYIGTIDTTTL